MSDLTSIVLTNTATATLLAGAVFALERFVRRPALIHALWLVVLLDLFVPPLLHVGVIPAPPIPTRTVVAPTADAPASRELARSVERPAAAEMVSPAGSSLPDPGTLALMLWLAGTAGVVVLAGVRWLRFRRLCSIAAVADPGLQRRVIRVARRFGLRRPPRARRIDARVAPMLLGGIGGPELLFPSELLSRLDPGELDALIAHELAHARRGDHWVRCLELATSALYWWHPLVWWVRARLRRVEERCCDELVTRVLPERTRDYARGLLEAIEFLAHRHNAAPVLASGVGELRELEERLTMIMKSRPTRAMSRTLQGLAGAGCVAVLMLFPGPVEPSEDSATAGEYVTEEYARAEADARLQRELVGLEAQALNLEHELREIRQHQRRLQREWSRRFEPEDLERLEHEAERRDVEERRHESDRVRAEAELHREHRQRQRQRQLDELRSRHEDARAAVEARLREAEIAKTREILDRELQLAELKEAGELARTEQLAEAREALARARGRLDDERRAEGHGRDDDDEMRALFETLNREVESIQRSIEELEQQLRQVK